jgi:hypothetical protein
MAGDILQQDLQKDLPKESSESKERLHYLDNIRWLMIVLVVLMHLKVTYGGMGSWYYQKNSVPPTHKCVGLRQALVFRMIRNAHPHSKECGFRKHF